MVMALLDAIAYRKHLLMIDINNSIADGYYHDLIQLGVYYRLLRAGGFFDE